ncbi:SMP-30/gluconolactonase/LRE family protein [Paracoccus litorisediminis]|uniref:SMP-30/gluconolactonase/LRE family protein n=1 Tax=Paracoccus litorisediminis TaxID=2006130 RepID=A0A844HNF3_9RHOB|nr:SMP-30/gluconolactonase/LRE family protein [Paracoccus litorisediminis]MTH61396.1 SMP-30/gluconolactonase/LRE family protein [Paracoccus litorisediminis]
MTKPQRFQPKVRQVIDMPLQVGESPVWDARTGALWFVDTLAPALFRRHADGRLDRFDMPAAAGSLGLCDSGLIVVGLQTGVHLLDPATAALSLLCDPDGGRADSRLNDGKVGPDGYFWVGTRDEAEPQTGNARLYRVAPDGSFATVLDGLLTSNGLAWSPDGRRMYHSDSSGLYVQAFDFDPMRGGIGDATRLHDNAPDEGRPDGAAMDAEGCYWSAGVRSGRLNRMNAQGEIIEIWEMPHKGCSMPCFGGPDLRTLYVTCLHMPRDDGTMQPGTLLAFDAPVAGAPVHRMSL